MILAGQGIIASGSTARLQQLAERAGIPIATTLLGIGGFPASHPLNLGMMGMHGEAWVNNAIQEADLLIALGMRFDDRVTGTLATYAPAARKIHVDIDAAEIGKNVHADMGIVADLADVLEILSLQVAPATRDAWHARIATSKGTPRSATFRICRTMAICMRRT